MSTRVALASLDDDNSSHPKENQSMPPPCRVYQPGTEEYRQALAAGQLQVSLQQQPLCSGKENQQPSDHNKEQGDDHRPSDTATTNSLLSPPPVGSTTTNSSTIPGAPVFQRVVSPNDDPTLPHQSQSKDQDDDSDVIMASTTGSESSSFMPPPTTTTFSQQEELLGDTNSAFYDDASNKDKEWDEPRDNNDLLPCDENGDAFIPSCGFCDIVGHGQVKLHMEEILLPFCLPPSVAETVFVGARALPTSILLYGPPGCGKTQLARAMAGEARAAYVPVAPSDILSKFVGESEASVRDVFAKAAQRAVQVPSQTCIVFLDELDALGQTRDDGNSSVGEGGCSRRVLAELLMVLSELNDNKKTKQQSRPSLASDYFDTTPADNMSCGSNDGVSPSGSALDSARILVVAATNRPQDLDPALLRRFGIQLYVGPPSTRDRKKLLRRHLKGIYTAISNENLDYLVAQLEGWTGSDISSLVRESVMSPVRECLHKSAVIRKQARKQRAAALSRPRPEQQQSGGVTSAEKDSSSSKQDSQFSEQNSDRKAQEFLLNAVTSLRPVTMQDFFQAMESLRYTVGSDYSNGSSPMARPSLQYDWDSDDEDY